MNKRNYVFSYFLNAGIAFRGGVRIFGGLVLAAFEALLCSYRGAGGVKTWLDMSPFPLLRAGLV
ncbi:hypothetical protein, partial [Enterobacter intestinihominis]